MFQAKVIRRKAPAQDLANLVPVEVAADEWLPGYLPKILAVPDPGLDPLKLVRLGRSLPGSDSGGGEQGLNVAAADGVGAVDPPPGQHRDQFPGISRPRVICQGFPEPGPGLLALQQFLVLLDQGPDILRALAQRRDLDFQDPKPVVKILAEFMAAHRLRQVLVGGGQEAHFSFFLVRFTDG